MNRKLRNLSLLSLAVAALAVMAWGCKDSGTDDSFKLYYGGISDIGPTMTFSSGVPSYYGPTPSDFAITGVKFEGADFSQEGFTISPETGAITVVVPPTLVEGKYSVSVSCVAAGKTFRFPDALEMFLCPAVPAAISVSPAVVTVALDDPNTDHWYEQTAQISFASNSVSAMSYELIQDDDKKYFAVDKSGVVSLNKAYAGEFPAGEYALDVRVNTYAGSKLFPQAVHFNLTSAPGTLTYDPATRRMEIGSSFTSPTPTLKGSPLGLSYAIKGVDPATTQIVIDPATGVISAPTGNTLTLGTTYKVSVTATNDYGTKDFDNVFSVEVIAFINPIANFSYAAASKAQATAFTIAKDASFVGDEVTYAFEDLPAALQGKLTLNVNTGDVSAAKGNTIPLGNYSVKVKATNTKNSVVATLALTIATNPNFFTSIHYGNNLNLTPVADYASQYRYMSAEEMDGVTLTPTHNIPGTATSVEWTLAIKQQMGGSTINPATGVLTLKGYKINQNGILFVTATTGKGTPEEVVVTVPVFFNFPEFSVSKAGSPYSYMVTYTPFVLKVNPRTGGTSGVPTVVGEGYDPSKFFLEYRRGPLYYNLGGPASHDGLVTVTTEPYNLLYSIIRYYYLVTTGQATVNTGAWAPYSYTANKANLSATIFYVDNANGRRVVVNPNRFLDWYGVYANGIFQAQMCYTANNDGTGITSNDTSQQVQPLLFWLDEKF